MAKKYNRESFLEKVTELYGDKYDFSEMDYVNQSTKIKVICSEHGEFWRAPTELVRNRRCFECAKISAAEGCRKPMTEEAKRKRAETNLKKYGATTYAGSKQAQIDRENGIGPWVKESRELAAQTNIKRYGAKTWAESDVGRETLSEMASSFEVRKEMSERMLKALPKRRETNLSRYGAEEWTTSNEGRKRLKELFNTDEERLARSQRMLDPNVRAKIEANGVRKYGVPYYWSTEEGRARLSSNEVILKKRRTMRLNGSYQVSNAEQSLHKLLISQFGEGDVLTQHFDSDRYPFSCDFYIKSLDLFIELNAYWTHGKHWFDESNMDDNSRLAEMKAKSEDRHSYQTAIYIWTERDPLKRETALKNGINYLVFWDNNLKDAKQWFAEGCPLSWCEK